MQKPNSTEYDPHYQSYIDLVPMGPFEDLLKENTKEVVDFFESIDRSKHDYRYAPNKWTIKQVFQHMIDMERGFSFRALVCVRKDDKVPLHGLEEDHYAANVDLTERSIKSLVEEFLAVRKSFAFLFENVPDENLQFLGKGEGHPVSARALGYIAIGHAKHHLNIIRERYLA